MESGDYEGYRGRSVSVLEAMKDDVLRQGVAGLEYVVVEQFEPMMLAAVENGSSALVNRM